MKRKWQYIRDAALTLASVVIMFFVSWLLDVLFFDHNRLTPMLFVLSVFFVALKTQGYFWGILASLLCVLSVNYAFTFPYYSIDLLSPENLTSAIVMLVVSVTTSTLTTKLSSQEKMKLEASREYMRANLLRAVSHDLRTPLTSIYGSCSAMIENYDSLRKEQHLKLLGEVQSDAQWLIRMVENLLSVTRIDNDRVQLAKVPTVLEELIDAVLIKFQNRCPQQTVDVDIPEDFISIPMDATLIEQVLINLLENAVDHAKGMTRLILRVKLSDGFAHFFVIDNGCGLDPERIQRLFSGACDSQSSLSDSRRSNMGIGLSVCATIIRAHGSEIHACNTPEGGALFTFPLRLEVFDE